MTYQVIVGNIGQIYSGRSFKEAEHRFEVYVKMSQDKYSGRVSNEPVTLLITDSFGSDSLREYYPNANEEN